MQTDLRHVLTVDVEEYFQVEAFSKYVARKDWDRYPGRVEEATDRLLEILADHRTRGTFFILGWLAKRNPRLVKRIAAAGHEVASHGFEHTMLTKMDPEEFRQDIRKSKNILEQITGNSLKGYRAPTFSIVKQTSWAHQVLAEEGYLYSSSVFPVRHDRYGWVEFGDEPRKLFSEEARTLWEVPLSVGSIGPFRVPFGGGGYLRLFPFSLTKRLLEDRVRAGKPVVVYVHPWELDANQPTIRAPALRRIRHWVGISRMKERLTELLRTLRFVGVARFLEIHGNDA